MRGTKGGKIREGRDCAGEGGVHRGVGGRICSERRGRGVNHAFPVVFRQAASIKSKLPPATARKWLTEKSMLPFRHCCSFSLKKKKKILPSKNFNDMQKS